MNLLPKKLEGKMFLTEWCQSLFNYTVSKYDS